MVTETIIEVAIEEVNRQLDQTDRPDKLVNPLEEEQPELVAYLFSNEDNMLSDDDIGGLFYMCLVSWLAIAAAERLPEQQIPADKISEIEEKNYGILLATKGKEFRDRLTPFFEDYPEEDLLAFVEDMLVEEEADEGQGTSTEAQEVMFVKMKTWIDALCSV